MEAKEIYNELFEKFKDYNIPLMYAMFEEVSEQVAESDVSDEDKVSTAIVVFYTNLKFIMAFLNTAFQNADVVTINYRGQSFELTPESLFVKAFSQL